MAGILTAKASSKLIYCPNQFSFVCATKIKVQAPDAPQSTHQISLKTHRLRDVPLDQVKVGGMATATLIKPYVVFKPDVHTSREQQMHTIDSQLILAQTSN